MVCEGGCKSIVRRTFHRQIPKRGKRKRRTGTGINLRTRNIQQFLFSDVLMQVASGARAQDRDVALLLSPRPISI